ncbi:MAG: rod-binding protein [Pseudomonadota bacterium]
MTDLPINSVGQPLSAPKERNVNGAGKTEPRDRELMETAKEFESVFIAEMLKHSGLTEAIASDGGAGGDAFSSFLVQEYAQALSEQGGFGLAETIYRQLKETDTNGKQ